jgi:hypothetical protein
MRVLWQGIENTIRGKVVVSPKFRLWWILWVYVCSWFVFKAKVPQPCITNLLFGLYKFVWIIDLLVTLLNCRNPTLEEWEDDSLTPKMGTWESARTPKISEFDCKGQNTSHRNVLYIIGKLSKCTCRKWTRMSHLDIFSTNYDEKKGQESNWQFDFWPRNVANRPDRGVCRRSATYRWKALNEGYNFAWDLIAIKGLHMKLCTLKVARVLVVGISRLPLGSPETKSHLDVAPVKSYRVYYMGEGGGFPRIRVMINLKSPKLPVACPNINSAPESELTTLWLVECKFEWITKSLSLFLVPFRSFSTPPLPLPMLKVGSVPSSSSQFRFWVIWTHLRFN